jgi:hypothetical protein
MFDDDAGYLTWAERDDEAYDEMVREDKEFGSFADQLDEARHAASIPCRCTDQEDDEAAAELFQGERPS